MDSRWALVTAAASEPLTLSELKLHLRVDNSAEDALITSYGVAARQMVEDECWIALMPQTWDYFLDGWPAGDAFELPRPPLTSVTSITYRDADGVTHTFASANYRVDTGGDLGRVVLRPGAVWPSAALDTGSPVAVRFVAGYANAAATPALAKAAIYLLVGDLYAQREAAAGALTLTPTVQRVMNLLKIRY